MKYYQAWSRTVSRSLFCLLLSNWSYAAASAPTGLRSVLENLARESQLSKPACEDYDRKVKGLLRGASNGTPLPEKATVLKLLALSKEYPGTPEAFKMGLAKAHAEYGEKLEISKELALILSEMYACSLVTYYDTFRFLITSAGPRGLSASERQAVAQELFKRVAAELSPETTLINLAIQGALLTMLIDERVIEVSDAVFIESLRWNEQIEDMRLKVRSASKRDPNTIGLELALTKPIAMNLARIARRLMVR